MLGICVLYMCFYPAAKFGRILRLIVPEQTTLFAIWFVLILLQFSFQLDWTLLLVCVTYNQVCPP